MPEEENQINNEAVEAITPRFAMNEGSAMDYVRFLQKYPRNKQVCICGHNINSHTYSSQLGYACRSGNIWCECDTPMAVYAASDARVFKRSTHGYGRRHALGLGIATLIERGGTGEWIMDMVCSIRDCNETNLTVACLDKDGQVVPQSTKHSVLICHNHATIFGAWKLIQ